MSETGWVEDLKGKAMVKAIPSIIITVLEHNSNVHRLSAQCTQEREETRKRRSVKETHLKK